MRVTWRPAECRPGDMIRVRLGAVYHYGVFVSEEEIIQFGLPPLPEYSDVTPVVVLATDIGVFSCGKIVETARFGFPESVRRFSRAKTIERARARLGEEGYNLIHNNCEHFAYECVLGVKYCSQEEEARRKWNERPVCDVYIARIGGETEPDGVVPPARAEEIRACGHPGVRASKLAVWRLMQFGARRSFSREPEELSYRKNRFGKWTCGELWFSLAHSDTLAVAAVSNQPVGVDIEEAEGFLTRRGGELRALREKALTPRELALPAGEDPVLDFLRLWTRKESLYKRAGRGRFQPQRLPADTDGETRTFLLTEPARAVVSVSGTAPRLYYVENGKARRLSGEMMEDSCGSER